MIIKFLDLIIKNFLSVGEIRISLHKQGVVLVEGRNLDENDQDSNGSGKSAIIEAIVWCLFGRTIRGLRHDQVVNRFAKGNCSVTIRFSVREQTYTVRRYRKHKRHSNKLFLWNGDRIISFRHEEDTQQRICALLGVDYSSFTNTVIFGGLRPFASLSDSDQKKVLESMLHFGEFDKALQRTKTLISEMGDKAQILALKAERYKGRSDSLRERLKTLKEGENLYIRDLRRRYRDAKKKARHLRTDSEKLKKYTKRAEEADNIVQRLRQKASDAQAKVTQREKSIDRVRKSMSDRASLVGKPCPTCGTKISGDTIAAYMEHLLSEKQSLKKSLRRSKAKLIALESEVKYAVHGLKDLQDKLHAETLKVHKRDEAEEELRRCKKELDVASSSASPLDSEIAKTSIKYSQALSRHLVAGQKKSSLEKSLADLKFWEKGFGNQGIKALIIKEALPALNLKLAEYSKEIFGGKVDLEFKPTKTTKSGGERELFHVQYKARRGASSYLGESTGRKRRVDTCILLCFSWFSRTCNLLLCDELLDGLDESGRESVLRILAAQRQTCFVISHRRDIRSSVGGKIWTIVKKHGFSHLEAA